MCGIWLHLFLVKGVGGYIWYGAENYKHFLRRSKHTLNNTFLEWCVRWGESGVANSMQYLTSRFLANGTIYVHMLT